MYKCKETKIRWLVSCRETVIVQFPANSFPCHVQLQILATYSHFTILKQYFVFDKTAFSSATIEIIHFLELDSSERSISFLNITGFHCKMLLFFCSNVEDTYPY